MLWHQGESDANQADKTRTLAGNLYREYLEKLIRDSRRETGWRWKGRIRMRSRVSCGKIAGGASTSAGLVCANTPRAGWRKSRRGWKGN